MSPVPKARDAILEGIGSPVTTMMWGSAPFLSLIRLKASVRLFWARSLLIVHLAEIEAWRMGTLLFFFLSGERFPVFSPTIYPSLFSRESGHGSLATIISGATVYMLPSEAPGAGFSSSSLFNSARCAYWAKELICIPAFPLCLPPASLLVSNSAFWEMWIV